MGNSDSTARLRGVVATLKSPETAGKLLSADSASEVAFWNALWEEPIPAEDVFAAIQPTDVRVLVEDAFSNLRSLVQKCVGVLLLATTSEEGEEKKSRLQMALNSVRILTRIMPFLFEHKDVEVVQEMFWGTEGNRGGKPLALVLLHAVGELLFLPDFTIPSAKPDQEPLPPGKLDESKLWFSGVATDAKDYRQGTSKFDANREECLRLLLACLSETLYYPSAEYKPACNKWLVAACSSEFPNSSLLLFSLLNAALSYDPVGWGLPFGTDTEEPLRTVSIQVLVVLLDFAQPKDDSSGNVYCDIIASIHSAEDLSYVYTNVCRLLNLIPQAAKSYITPSSDTPSSYQECPGAAVENARWQQGISNSRTPS